MTDAGQEDVLALHSSRARSVLFLLLNGAFAALFVFLLVKEGGASWAQWWAWAGLALFGGGTLVFLANLLPGASYLKLDAQGFEVCSLFRRWRHSWSDVEVFYPGVMSHNTMIFFSYSQTYRKQPTGRKVSRFLTGAEGAIPETYGMKPAELADLLNAWKARSGSGGQ